MKKEYVTPTFYAEEYYFNESIASCQVNVDSNNPIKIFKGDNVCFGSDGVTADSGHGFGGQNGKSGNIISKDADKLRSENGNVFAVLFNDGIVATTGCEYDWEFGNGVNNITSPYEFIDGKPASRGSFAQAFYGNNANPEQHAPGHESGAFFS